MIVTKHMSITREAFVRQLARFAPGALEEVGADGWRIGVVRILARPMPPLTLGAARLERLAVTLDLSALPDGQARTFLARFDRAFFRGGG